MKNSKAILGGLVLALMAATSLLLLHMKANQHLGAPGVKTRPLADGKTLEILLPETVSGYTSEILTNVEAAMSSLPRDTTYRSRLYKSGADAWSQTEVTAVLMGSDRSSIHKPQICMTGQGWQLDSTHSTVEPIHLERPQPYDLPVNKLLFSKTVQDANGQRVNVRGIYIYWFVDAEHMTANPNQWMLWWMPRDLLLHGLLERWSYISVFSACPPGEEDATYARMKKMIADAVPEFQLVPRAEK